MRLSRLIAIAAATMLLAAGCGNRTEKPGVEQSGPVKQVTVALAEQRGLLEVQKIVGSVEARSQAQIETKVQARVEKIAVSLGSRVRTGDLLVEFDTRDLSARVKQAQAVFDQAAQDLKRFETLLSQQAATQQEYDGVKARAAVAEANREEAEAALSYARIVAPFSGVVTQKTIEVGDLAVPGRPLFVLEQVGSPRFVLTIPESNADRIRSGDSVRIEIPAADTTISGVVTELSPSADPVTRSYEVKIDLPENPRVRPGQFGKLLLPTGNSDALFVPSGAVVRRGQLELVYTVTAEGRASMRLVRTGREQAGWTEILSGLRANDHVVISSSSELSDGDKVEMKP
jgi:RND family efflux transporter MFP subunit